MKFRFLLLCIMGVLNRLRCVKAITVFIGLYFIAQLNYHRIMDMKSNVTPSLLKSNETTNHQNFAIPTKLNKVGYKFFEIEKRDKNWYREEKIIERTVNCKKYFSEYLPVFAMNNEIIEYEKNFINSEVTKLAFSHMLHNHVAIYEAFLAMYFRPYNFYCIHIDLKADAVVRDAVESLISCYENEVTTGKIFMVDKQESIEVEWGTPSVLEADLICTRKFLEINKQNPQQAWTYTSSMAGSELPIVTYAKFHKTVSGLGQKSAVESSRPCESFRYKGCANEQLLLRITDSQMKTCTNCWVTSNDPKDYEICNFKICKNSKNITKPKHHKTRLDKKADKFSIPYTAWNIREPLVFQLPNPLQPNKFYKFQLFKGLKNVILHRNDADFMLNHPVGKQIYEWQKDSKIPEETLFPTLIRLRINEENGDILQDIASDENHTTHGICSRFTQWNKKIQLPNGRWKWVENVQMGIKDYPVKYKCHGEYIHWICNFKESDLPKIDEENTHCLMGNKFNLDLDPSAVGMQFKSVLSKSINEANNT